MLDGKVIFAYRKQIMETTVKSIRIIDPETIRIVERFQAATRTGTATKAAEKIIQRFDAQSSQGVGDRQGMEMSKESNLSTPAANSNSAA